MPLKRSTKPASSLVRTTSAYHPAVTLFELPPASAMSSGLHRSESEDANADGSPRRSKRIKLETDADGSAAQSSEPDLSSNTMGSELADAKQAAVHGIASTSRHTLEGAEGQGSSRKRLRDVKSPRKRSSATVARQSGASSAPARWREAYEKIKEMRSNITAPVDTMGAGAAQMGETVPKVRTPRLCACAFTELRNAEPTLRYLSIFDALVSNKGRGHIRSSTQAARGCWR